jgi:hypothetical protein
MKGGIERILWWSGMRGRNEQNDDATDTQWVLD